MAYRYYPFGSLRATGHINCIDCGRQTRVVIRPGSFEQRCGNCDAPFGIGIVVYAFQSARLSKPVDGRPMPDALRETIRNFGDEATESELWFSSDEGTQLTPPVEAQAGLKRSEIACEVGGRWSRGHANQVRTLKPERLGLRSEAPEPDPFGMLRFSDER